MDDYPVLNLPSFEARIEIKDDQRFIFDVVRKKMVVLTPEEWVRQHFIHLLIEKLGYPAGLFQVETKHEYFQKTKRTDLTILDRFGMPFLIVECKTFTEKVNEKTLNQVAVYNKSLKARYVSITNGMKHFVWAFDGANYEQQAEFPLPEKI